MSFIDDTWSEYHAKRSRKRQENQLQSTKILKQSGYNFRSFNGGIHLVITHYNRVFDFWPSTGKWRERGEEVYQRGVFKLIKQLRKLEPKPNGGQF